jgi:hypothetical protein
MGRLEGIFGQSELRSREEEVGEVPLKLRATLTIRCENQKWDLDDGILQ